MDEKYLENNIKICNIGEGCNECKNKCDNCLFNTSCDFVWINDLWVSENKKFGKNSLLGPAMPIFIKTDLKKEHIISITGKYDFCCFNAPRSKDVVVIGDIYVDDAARGQGISKKLIQYLMETYDRDIFAKCVRGSSAEEFWKHLGIQVDANDGRGPDMYEHREGKRDLGWYRVENKNKKIIKEDLW